MIVLLMFTMDGINNEPVVDMIDGLSTTLPIRGICGKDVLNISLNRSIEEVFKLITSPNPEDPTNAVI